MGLPSARTVFDRVERAVGAPLEDAVGSPRYGVAVSFWVNGPRAVHRSVRGAVDDKLAGVLHALNIPTRGDVTRLSRQMAVLTAEVRALSVPTDRISNYVEQLAQREAVRHALPADETAPGAAPPGSRMHPVRSDGP